MTTKPRGRPKKYAEYDALVANLPKPMAKRPKYVNGIGVFRGARSDTAWVKIRLTHGGTYKGHSYPKGAAAEIKLGNLSSWSWKDLEAKRDELQGRADRAEPLEDEASQLFSEYAMGWLDRLKKRTKGSHTTEITLKAHLLGVFGDLRLDQIRVRDINSYISRRLPDANASTVKREVNTLNAILNDAVKNGHLEANPGRHADRIKGITPRQLNPKKRGGACPSYRLELSQIDRDRIVWVFVFRALHIKRCLVVRIGRPLRLWRRCCRLTGRLFERQVLRPVAPFHNLEVRDLRISLPDLPRRCAVELHDRDFAEIVVTALHFVLLI